MSTTGTIEQPDFPSQVLHLENGAALNPPIVFGSFTLHTLVRKSNMSLVFRGARTGTNVEVAVKICQPNADTSRFLREIRNTQSIGIKRVIKIDNKDVGVTKNDCPFYATGWIEGCTLAEFLKDRANSLDAKLQVIVELCQIVSMLHVMRLSHRDLKPSNVIVHDNDYHHVTLLDLGLSRLEDDEDLTPTAHHIGGTEGYRPVWSLKNPSLIRKYESQWDVYSLAVILVQALTGVTPEGDNDPRFTPAGAKQLVGKHLPENHRFDALLSASLSSDPGKCPPNGDALYDLLRKCSGLPGKKTQKKSRSKVLAVASLVLLFGVGYAIFPSRVLIKYDAAMEWIRTKLSAESVMDSQFTGGNKDNPEEVQFIGGNQAERIEDARQVDSRIIPNPSSTNQAPVDGLFQDGNIVFDTTNGGPTLDTNSTNRITSSINRDENGPIQVNMSVGNDAHNSPMTANANRYYTTVLGEKEKIWSSTEFPFNIVVATDGGTLFVATDEGMHSVSYDVEGLKLAAEQGDAIAQLVLGEMYKGGFGVVRDDKEAVKWFQQAAEQGHVRAQYFRWIGIEMEDESFPGGYITTPDR